MSVQKINVSHRGRSHPERVRLSGHFRVSERESGVFLDRRRSVPEGADFGRPQHQGAGQDRAQNASEKSRRHVARLSYSGRKGDFARQLQGVPPDLLENGFPVIAERKLDGKGVLVAKNLMVACPSKFEEMKEAGKNIPTDRETLMKEATKRKQVSEAK